MKYGILVMLVLISGCVLFERKPDPPPIIQSKCLGARPVKPQYLFGQLPPAQSEADAAKAVQQLMLDFKASDQYGLDWETAASGCM